MPEPSKAVGAISWADLTVPNAEQVKDFYAAVVGWTHSSIEMGGYDDFCMNKPVDGETVAGICHARGANAELPAQWLLYVNVADLDKSIEACTSNGGTVLQAPRNAGGGKMAVIQDPAGACMALFEQPASE